MELHERVRFLRTQILNNMSQSDFAEMLGATRDEINNIEGNRLKKPETKKPLLLLMCAKFGVSEDWLLYDIGGPENNVEDEDAAIVASLLDDTDSFASVIKAIMRAYNDSSDQDKLAIKRFADRLISTKKESRD